MRQCPDSLLGDEHALLELAGVAAWKYFFDGQFDFSPAMYDMFELEPGCTGQDVLARYHPDDRNYVTRGIAKTFATKGALSSHYRIQLPNGNIRQILSTATYKNGEKGPEVVGVNIDVTSHFNEMKIDKKKKIKKINPKIDNNNKNNTPPPPPTKTTTSSSS